MSHIWQKLFIPNIWYSSAENYENILVLHVLVHQHFIHFGPCQHGKSEIRLLLVLLTLSFHLLSKNVILPVVLYGCETWSITLREEHRLRVFENRLLKRNFWSKRKQVTGGWKRLHKEELQNLYSSPVIRLIKSKRFDEQVTWHSWKKLKRHTYFLLETLKGRDHLEDPSIDGMMLKCIVKKYNKKVWTGFIWPRTGTGGGIIWTR